MIHGKPRAPTADRSPAVSVDTPAFFCQRKQNLDALSRVSYGALAACLDQVPFYQVFERISPRRLYHRAVPTAGHPSTRDTNRPCLKVGRERPDVRLCYSALTNSNASKMSFKLNTHSMFATRPVGLCQCLFPANSLTSVQRCRACAPAVRAPATTIIRATPSSRATHSSPPCSR